ncbi:MAG: ABC transporter permease subunit [Candidatus Binatia bacterium]
MGEVSTQDIAQPHVPEQPVSARLSTIEDKARLRRKKLADKAADLTITAGGIAIILSIAAILLVIFAETLPLWRSPTATPVTTLDLLQSTTTPAPLPVTPSPSTVLGKPLAFGVDEYQSIAYVLRENGVVDFVSLTDNQLLKHYEVQALQRQQPTVAYRDGLSHLIAVGTANGIVVPLRIIFSVDFVDGKRTLIPSVKEGTPLTIDPAGRAIRTLAYRETEGKTSVAALLGPRALIFFAQETTTSLLGVSSAEESRTDLSAQLNSDATALALDKYHANLLVGTSTGNVQHWNISDAASPQLTESFTVASQANAEVSTLGWLLGDRSLIVGDTAGAISIWTQVRDPHDPAKMNYHRIHTLRSHTAAVVAVTPSPRDKGFLSADHTGQILLHHATSEQTLLEVHAQSPTALLTMAPKSDGILTVGNDAKLSSWFLYNPHPEINLRTLFGKVWYEGYDHPDYTWQSSSGSDEFEPKFSLTPLAYGTLKGTFYAMLLAIPISICAALFTSQFLHPSLRNTIKPTVEVMAALPSVVLGFFAGLWLAPRIEKMVPGVFLMLIALPLVTLAAAFVWRLVPLPVRSRFRPGVEVFFIAPLLVLAAYGCIVLNGVIEATFFGGNFPQWLYDTTGVRYDPRNSLVVGFAMGFAIIPIIYTICEDAFSNVPQHLVSGSLALGATRWQTALRVVLPTASPGVFSAVMIGFGRAVGETMIVLMATGNTPVMDWNAFSGFRALSANIAVEIPEAPEGGTLYRVLFLGALLLFILTFLVNTVAELVRQRLRERYSKI